VSPQPNDAQCIAVLPARGGSKRVPAKNVRTIGGRPILAWTIEVVLESQLFSEVRVSTDSSHIAAIAQDAGAVVSGLRPSELADDFASTAEVMMHAVQQAVDSGFPGKFACCVYPTAIGLQPDDLWKSFALLTNSTRPFVAAVTRYSHPIQRAFHLSGALEIEFDDPSALEKRTQDLPSHWHDAGQFYWGTLAAWLHGAAVLPNSVGYSMPSHRVVDIDTEEDWLRAEQIHKSLRCK